MSRIYHHQKLRRTRKEMNEGAAPSVKHKKNIAVEQYQYFH
jgi:hypothetical protein